MKKIFITATDTDAGKTFISCAITSALVQQQLKVAVFKPISAGCTLENGELINEDAKLLSQFANCQQTISEINPVAFKEPIAPHIAAAKLGCKLEVSQLELTFNTVLQNKADITLVEGAGGWRLPLGYSQNSATFLSDFVVSQQLDVILVVNMKLGCLNHALLTYQAILSDGLHCIGWIANCAGANAMSDLRQNITELEQLLPVKKMAEIPFYDPNEYEISLAISAASSLIDVSQVISNRH